MDFIRNWLARKALEAELSVASDMLAAEVKASLKGPWTMSVFVKGAVAAFLGGIASGVASVFSGGVPHDKASLFRAALSAVVGGLTALVAYLKQSPLPAGK